MFKENRYRRIKEARKGVGSKECEMVYVYLQAGIVCRRMRAANERTDTRL